MSADLSAIPSNAEICAKRMNLDFAKLKACQSGPLGKQLMAEVRLL